MSGTLFILNDTPYGTERTYNGLRLAAALTKRGNNDVRVLLVGDAVAAAMAGQKLPDGYYHFDRILAPAPATAPTSPAAVPAWDARGITEDMLTKGTRRSALDELADWTEQADKVITF